MARTQKGAGHAWGSLPRLGPGSPFWFLLELWLLSPSVPGRSGEARGPGGSRMPTWRKVKEELLSLISCSSKGRRGATNKDMWSFCRHLLRQTAAGHNFWWGHPRWPPSAWASPAPSFCLRGTLRLDTFLCADIRIRVRTAWNHFWLHNNQATGG